MKKRTKILSGLSAAVLALSAVGFGFSQWSSNLTLGGNVNVKGSWNVGITDAKIQSVSAGAVVDAEAVEVAPTVEVTVYNVYAHRYNTNASLGDLYRYQIDDENPYTITVSMDDLETFDKGDVNIGIPGSGPPQYSFYTSGKYTSVGSGSIFYRMWYTDLGRELGFTTVGSTGVACTDDGAHDGELIAVAIGSHQADRNNPWNIDCKAYNNAVAALNAMEAKTIYPATVSEDGLTATYGDVSLTIPGAWAEYAVTVTNNGTVNANLNDYVLEVTGMEGDIVVNTPELADEVLAPGDSCTVTFVAQVPADYAEPTLDAQGTLSVRLVFVQDAVEAAPTPSVTH